MQEFMPFYAQVFGIGLLWVTVHCMGMCGPIMASLTAGMGVHRAKTPGQRIRRAVAGVLAYQGGRSIVYLALGASAGLAGAAAKGVIEDLTQTAGLVVAVVIIVVGILKLLPLRGLMGGALALKAAAVTGKLLRWARKVGPRSGPVAMAIFGFVMGFLPCMLMFWVLGVAASSASAFHGAMLMLMLVVMTTPLLILAATGSSLPGVFRHLRSDRVIGGAMIMSGVWLGLIAMAANGWIEHIHFPIEVFGEKLTIMLW
jgi:sulfite exporter TauE/SafE